MAFQLIIRNNLKQDADSFAKSTAADFENGLALIGSSEECDVQVLDEEGRAGDEIWFSIEEKGGALKLSHKTDLDLFLNQNPLTTPAADLISGDEVRIGHWTFRVQKLHPKVSFAKHTDRVGRILKVGLAVLIILQVLTALWIPGYLDYESLAPQTITEQKTILQIDHIRRRINSFPEEAREKETHEAFFQIVSKQVDEIASYMRRHQERIPYSLWLIITEDLRFYERLLDQIEEEELPPTPADLDIPSAVRKIESENAGWIKEFLQRIEHEASLPAPLD